MMEGVLITPPFSYTLNKGNVEYKEVTNCRICNSADLIPYLDLGNKPLPNNLSLQKDSVVSNYPLKVLLCKNCSLSQLSVVVPPSKMFKNYLYHSSVSDTFRTHCRSLSRKAEWMLKKEKGFSKECCCVIDIAANDGCLLNQFEKLGFKWLIAVEPASNLTKKYQSKRIMAVNSFWEDAIVPSADIITATNVLAHVDGIVDFVTKIRDTLAKFRKSFCVVEVPYLYDLIKGNEFDTIYHEHLSYFLFKPLKILFESAGLKIFKVERLKIHGGSLRIYSSLINHSAIVYEKGYKPSGKKEDREHCRYKKVTHFKEDRSVKSLLKFEEKNGLYDISFYEDFSRRVNLAKTKFITFLENAYRDGKKVIGYCASAKGISLLNYFCVGERLLNAIVDDTPDKQGKFTPGSHLQIVSREYIDNFLPDYIVILSWNFSKEVMNKVKFKGKWVVAIPCLKIMK